MTDFQNIDFEEQEQDELKEKLDLITITSPKNLDTLTGITDLQADAIVANTLKNTYPSADATKVGFITITQNVNLDSLENSVISNSTNLSSVMNENIQQGTDIQGLKNLIEVNSSHTRIKTTTNNKIEFYEGSTELFDSNEVKNLTDNISITQNVNLDTIESDVTGIKNNTLSSTLKTAVDSNTSSASQNQIVISATATKVANIVGSSTAPAPTDNLVIGSGGATNRYVRIGYGNQSNRVGFANEAYFTGGGVYAVEQDNNGDLYLDGYKIVIGSQNLNLTTMNNNISGLQDLIEVNSSNTRVKTTTNNRIEFYEGNTELFNSDEIKNLVDNISVTQAVNLDTMESNIATNNAKIGFPSSLNNLLSVTDTYELEVGSGSGIPRIRLNGANGVNTSSEIIFIDATGNNPEYYQGFTLRYNSADNIFQIGADDNNNNSPLECLRIDRSTRESQFKKVCVYLDEIEAKGASGVTPANANLMLTTKLGSLPGYSSNYYPTVKTSFSFMYFAVGGIYVGYLTNTTVGQIDFTAQHKAVPVNNNLINDLSNNIGKIVISNGEICSLIEDSSGIFQPTTGKAGITINEAIPKVLLSNKYKDKRIFGVISDGLDNEPNGEKHYKVGAFTSVIHSDENDNRLFINSGGEGAILVTDICGNIENGDLITTSVVEGIGCKQDDDLIHSYTIAKATIDCDFNVNSNNYNCYIDENNNKISLISCIYLL